MLRREPLRARLAGRAMIQAGPRGRRHRSEAARAWRRRARSVAARAMWCRQYWRAGAGVVRLASTELGRHRADLTTGLAERVGALCCAASLPLGSARVQHGVCAPANNVSGLASIKQQPSPLGLSARLPCDGRRGAATASGERRAASSQQPAASGQRAQRQAAASRCAACAASELRAALAVGRRRIAIGRRGRGPSPTWRCRRALEVPGMTLAGATLP